MKRALIEYLQKYGFKGEIEAMLKKFIYKNISRESRHLSL